MTTLKSIFKIYGIKKALINDGEKLEIVLVEREQNLTLDRWINFINSIKYSCKKDVVFATSKDVDISSFVVVWGESDE